MRPPLLCASASAQLLPLLSTPCPAPTSAQLPPLLLAPDLDIRDPLGSFQKAGPGPTLWAGGGGDGKVSGEVGCKVVGGGQIRGQGEWQGAEWGAEVGDRVQGGVLRGPSRCGGVRVGVGELEFTGCAHFCLR